jgi:hypothetical protein
MKDLNDPSKKKMKDLNVEIRRNKISSIDTKSNDFIKKID